MQDLYLKFADEAEADAMLYTDGMQNYVNTDILGIIYEPASDGADPLPLPGWHVNIRLMPDEDPAPLLNYQVYPQLPRRVWA